LTIHLSARELVRDQTIAQATLDQREADHAAATADVMQAQVMLDQAQINLGYTEIKSPIDGRIGLAHFTVGNLVDPASGNAEETKLDVERVIAAFLHSAR
jgi:membrane fusion protein (multidrug efflux system)